METAAIKSKVERYVIIVMGFQFPEAAAVSTPTITIDCFVSASTN